MKGDFSNMPIDRNDSGRKYSILLVILILFHVISNLIIVTADNTPLLWDGGDYFYKSLKYYDVFKNPGPDFVSRFNDVSHYRPPLLMLTSLPLYAVFGRSVDTAIMTNTLYLIILVLSVYGIGRRLHSDKAGFLSAVIVMLFPIVFGLSRSYWQDFPVTAMASLSVYLLLRTDYFRDRKYSLLFGISLGLGMLSKWIHFVFLTGPFLYILWLSLKQGVKIPVRNAAYAILAGAAVASFWYIPNGLHVATNLLGLSVGVTGEEATTFQNLGESFGPTGIFNIRSFTYYPAKLVNDQISFFFAVVFTVFAVSLLKRHRDKNLWMLILWVIVPIIAFTLIKNKTPRNTVAILPAISLMISFGIMNMKSPAARKAAAGFILIFGFFQYAVNSYVKLPVPERLALKTSLGDVVFLDQYEKNPSHAIFHPNKGDWKADEILDMINADRGDKEDVSIVLLPRDAFTWMSMEYTSYFKEMPFTFIGAVNSPEAVLEADYVLVKKGGFVAPWFLMRNIHASLDLMEDHGDKFTLLTSVVLPEERTTLPLYDVASTRMGRKSGVVFSEKLQVIDYSVSEEPEGTGKKFTVEATVKGIKDIDADMTALFNITNKKMETLLRKGVKPLPPISGLKAGEGRAIKATVTVPPDIAKDFFGLELGFLDASGNKPLTYAPEYMIYRRNVINHE
ncbi:MAG: phospholipid carrier-dependent glycosyltransferase [Nitrospiraceae bacterium]|nr:MAG: phospholipid carrier-dependent glycosyltransferase [Nitrospiraceae bacterium]